MDTDNEFPDPYPLARDHTDPVQRIVDQTQRLGRELDAIKNALYWIIALLAALLVSIWQG